MAASVGIDTHSINPKADIRILGLQIDSKLKWGPHVRLLEGRMTKQSLALSRISASTWGITLQKTRLVYTAVVRPAISFAAATWFESPPRKGQHEQHTKGTKKIEKKLQVIQNRCLRIVTGAFKATPIPVLEAEAGVPLITLFLEGT
jgi:hypothetical protein